MDINLGLSAVATGTVDVITATYSPAPTLVDKKILFLRAIGANTTTTPTFNPNSLGAKVITKLGGTALEVGDISGDGFVALMMYESANNRWVLLNPKISFTPTLAQVLANGSVTGGTSITITDGDKIKSANSQCEIDFGSGTSFGITTDAGVYNTPYVYIAPSQEASLGYDGQKAVIINATDSKLKHSSLVKLDAPNVNLVQESASLILSTDASKNIKGLALTTYPSLTELSYVKGVTSAIQTQLGNKQAASAVLTSLTTLGATAFGTTAGTFAQGNDSRFTDSRYQKIYSYSNTTTSHTGSLTETILKAIALPLMGANDIIDLQARLVSSGAGGTKAFVCYLSTSAVSVAGATQIGGRTNGTGNRITTFKRTIVNKNSVSTNSVYTTGVTIPNDDSLDNTSASPNAINLDLSTQYYLVITVALANTGDTGQVDDVQIYWNKA